MATLLGYAKESVAGTEPRPWDGYRISEDAWRWVEFYREPSALAARLAADSEAAGGRVVQSGTEKTTWQADDGGPVYTRVGVGSWSSAEHGVCPGDVRWIDGREFYAITVKPGRPGIFGRGPSTVYWTLVDRAPAVNPVPTLAAMLERVNKRVCDLDSSVTAAVARLDRERAELAGKLDAAAQKGSESLKLAHDRISAARLHRDGVTEVTLRDFRSRLDALEAAAAPAKKGKAKA